MLGSVCLFRVEKRLARRAWLGAPTSFTWDTCWELVSSFNARLRRTSQLIDGPLSPLLALWLDRWQGGRLFIFSFLLLLFSLPGILVWMGAQEGALYKFSVYIDISYRLISPTSYHLCGYIPTCVNNCLQRIRRENWHKYAVAES